jgi:hypothetical protein
MTARRLRAPVLASLVWLIASLPMAGAAAAHGAVTATPDAAHYLTMITSVSPRVPGVNVQVSRRGDWISVTNTTPQTLTVFGYFHEPYLQIAPTGVTQNVYSGSVQLNQSLFADLAQTTASTLPPTWQRTSSARTARWHDHRIHWMTADRPPNVKAHPGRRQEIGAWNVRLQLGATPITVTGTLSWLPINGLGVTAGQALMLALDVGALLIGVLGIALYVVHQRRSAAEAADQRVAQRLTKVINATQTPASGQLGHQRVGTGDHS